MTVRKLGALVVFSTLCFTFAQKLLLDSGFISAEQQLSARVLSGGQTTNDSVHTQVGFLNIHSEPGDPWRKDNIVGRWLEGDIVEVISDPLKTEYGPWLQASAGWSIQIYDGFYWLRPVEDQDNDETSKLSDPTPTPLANSAQPERDMNATPEAGVKLTSSASAFDDSDQMLKLIQNFPSKTRDFATTSFETNLE